MPHPVPSGSVGSVGSPRGRPAGPTPRWGRPGSGSGWRSGRRSERGSFQGRASAVRDAAQGDDREGPGQVRLLLVAGQLQQGVDRAGVADQAQGRGDRRLGGQAAGLRQAGDQGVDHALVPEQAQGDGRRAHQVGLELRLGQDGLDRLDRLARADHAEGQGQVAARARRAVLQEALEQQVLGPDVPGDAQADRQGSGLVGGARLLEGLAQGLAALELEPVARLLERALEDPGGQGRPAARLLLAARQLLREQGAHLGGARDRVALAVARSAADPPEGDQREVLRQPVGVALHRVGQHLADLGVERVLVGVADAPQGQGAPLTDLARAPRRRAQLRGQPLDRHLAQGEVRGNRLEQTSQRHRRLGAHRALLAAVVEPRDQPAHLVLARQQTAGSASSREPSASGLRGSTGSGTSPMAFDARHGQLGGRMVGSSRSDHRGEPAHDAQTLVGVGAASDQSEP